MVLNTHVVPSFIAKFPLLFSDRAKCNKFTQVISFKYRGYRRFAVLNLQYVKCNLHVLIS